jgi:FAD/FMN-containing dehydrogenase
MESLYQALGAWTILLGADAVVTDEARRAQYATDTSDLRRAIPAVLLPKSAEQVAAVVRIAVDAGIPLYPISTGNNWGYGTANPVRDGCVIVDLSGMRRIREMDAETGVVTLEPGVTQRGLREFLDEHSLEFLVPVSGAGPDCSIVGNALERGYGITPYADHFAAVMGIEAVLPDGALYRTPLAELGGAAVDRAFKWGVGPYLDGIFSQGSFGIVTAMTIALAPTPERIEGFFFGIEDDANLEAAVRAVRQALRDATGTVGSINLMNRRRVLSMLEPYPSSRRGRDELIPEAELEEMARRNQVMAWTGAGAIYGSAEMVRAARRMIRKALARVGRRLVFLTPQRTQGLLRFSRRLPGFLGRRAEHMLAPVERVLQLLAGAPSNIALPLSYWRSGRLPTPGEPMNPARDGCGLLWYSPLVPMSPEQVRRYTALVESICRRWGIEPLITLTSLSDRCWDSTVPILFDKTNAGDLERAWGCYTALFDAGRANGFIPYRAHVALMDQFIRDDSPYWQTVARIKKAIDPAGIISPGRYAP